MLISKNRVPSLKEFMELVTRATNYMNQEVYENPDKAIYYRTRNGSKLEEDIYKVLKKEAVGTKFENSIKLVSNRSFPDIVAAKYYGVEVKTSKKSWKSVGSSIMESSRIQDVEHICLFFGKLDKAVEFRVRLYEECLSEIVVTHSPRYSIDMDLVTGDTIFDKMNTRYNDFRNLDYPINVVKDYYGSMLREGQELWWMTDSGEALSPVVRLWNTLKKEEKNEFKVKGFCWFPEIFGTSSSKYNRFALWMTTQNGVVPTSLRDIYSAGGRGSIPTKNGLLTEQPQVIIQLNNSKHLVMNELLSADKDFVGEMWGVSHVFDGEDRMRQWIQLVNNHGITKRTLFDIFDL